MDKDFSISDAVNYGWEIMKSNFWILLASMLIVWIVPSIPTVFANMFKSSIPSLYILLNIVSYALSFFLMIGLLRILLALSDNREVQISDILLGRDLFLYYVVGSVLYFLIITGGFILFIIPGIILSIKYKFCQLIIVDQQISPVDALKESSRLTDGVKGRLFVFVLAIGCINILGLLLFGLGLLVSIPVTMLATIYVYKNLLVSSTAYLPDTDANIS